MNAEVNENADEIVLQRADGSESESVKEGKEGADNVGADVVRDTDVGVGVYVGVDALAEILTARDAIQDVTVTKKG